MESKRITRGDSGGLYPGHRVRHNDSLTLIPGDSTLSLQNPVKGATIMSFSRVILLIVCIVVTFSAAYPASAFVTLTLDMPSDLFSPYDPFYVDLALGNRDTAYPGAQLFVCLEVIPGSYYFWPSFTEYPPNIDFETIDMAADYASVKFIIPQFYWPEGTGEFHGARFYAAVIWEGELVSNLAVREFGWVDTLNWQVETVDVDAGFLCSITLDADQDPHISYFDDSFNSKYACRSNGTWTKSDVSGHMSRINNGDRTDIAVDATGRVHISYYDSQVQNLMYAVGSGSSWQIEPVDVPGFDYYCTSLCLDAAANPHIVYCEYRSGAQIGSLRYASRIAGIWEVETIFEENGVKYDSSFMAMDDFDMPYICFTDYPGRRLRFGIRAPDGWQCTIVDNNGSNGLESSIALDSRYNPHFSYYGEENDLRYARLSVSGTEFLNETVDSDGNVGYNTAIGLDAQDNPKIVYYDLDNKQLKYARKIMGIWQISPMIPICIDPGIRYPCTGIAIDNRGSPSVCVYDNNIGNPVLKYVYLN